MGEWAVTIEESEFLSSSDIRNFETQLHSYVRTFLESTDPSVAPLLGTITLVLTGGGRDLPMVASLAQQSWAVHGATTHHSLAPSCGSSCSSARKFSSDTSPFVFIFLANST